MDINTCFETTVGSRGLALYANVAPAIASLILAGFVWYRASNRTKARLFASFVGVFALWLLANGVIWNANDYYLVAALWSPLAYLELAFFLLLFGFFYFDIYNKIPLWLNGLVVLISAPSFALMVTGRATEGFEQMWCNIIDNQNLISYHLGIEIVILLAILIIGLTRFIQLKRDRTERIRVGLITVGVVLFMGTFSGSIYISSNSTAYLTELYALFTLPVFILVLTVAITSYGTFRLGNAVASVLFYIFLIFAGSQFFFVTSAAGLVLTGISFLMILSFGVMLFRSYQREAEMRTEVENLAHELEDTNQRQETLIHFIGHEVKGFLTKDAGAFASLLDGDFAPLPEAVKPFVTQALQQSRGGADSVTNILKASNLKKGTVTYAKIPFNMNDLVIAAVEKAKQMAEGKGLKLTFVAGEGNYQMTGDGPQIADHVLRNLIENAINYTPAGTVEVLLARKDKNIVFAVKDSGVGITDEDKKRLFTEGGHGAESQKVNVHSTGYGLYIAKQITEAHGGTIRAESEGAGKGSTFIAEFPVT